MKTKLEEKSIALPTESNCTICKEQVSDKVIFHFPKDGTIKPGCHKFDSWNEIAQYIASIFSLDGNEGCLQGTIRCEGKYQRVNAQNEPIFTFGDPILDLITNETGEIFIAGQHFCLRQEEISEPRYRSGGIRSIDLSVHNEVIFHNQLIHAANGEGRFTLLECTDLYCAFASANPSQLDFYKDGGHMRFKAWKKSRFLYWSMGAEIETWGGDFRTARIESRYLDRVGGNICAVVKTDSDSDSNDDYVDEYEWGVSAPQPTRVVSFCTADWKNQTFSGQVEAGSECFEI